MRFFAPRSAELANIPSFCVYVNEDAAKERYPDQEIVEVDAYEMDDFKVMDKRGRDLLDNDDFMEFLLCLEVGELERILESNHLDDLVWQYHDLKLKRIA